MLDCASLSEQGIFVGPIVASDGILGKVKIVIGR